MSPFKKIDIESRFTTYATGGNILHIEIDAVNTNLDSMLQILQYAHSKDVCYLRFSHKSSTCRDCGYKVETYMPKCIKCDSDNVEILSTLTGYLTTSLDNLNKGKAAEVVDRVIHK